MEVDANDHDFVGSEGNSAESIICSVCLSKVSDLTNARVLPCGHIFHASCISTWLNHGSTCPECRNNIHANGSSNVKWIHELVKLMVAIPNSDTLERTGDNFVSETNATHWMIFATTWIAGILVIIMLSDYSRGCNLRV